MNSQLTMNQTSTEVVNFTLNEEKPLIRDLYKDVQDGLILSRYIEKETGMEIKGLNKNPSSDEDKIQNLTVLIEFIKNEMKIKNPPSPQQIFAGEQKAILNLLFFLMFRFRLGGLFMTMRSS